MENNMNLRKSFLPKYSFKEELANCITHGLGVLFSIVTLTILLVFAILQKSTIAIVSFSIYGFCSISLYLASTLYHSIQKEKVRKVLRIFDHSSIYLFIAGTYTPITLIGLKGYWGFGILTAVWTIAIGGILLKIFTTNKTGKYSVISLILYVVMGWLVIVAIKPMIQTISVGFLMWLLAGGIVYTVGIIFYVIKKIPFNHAIWHLFVLGGSVLHFIGIFLYLI